jgi:hypothetical protein
LEIKATFRKPENGCGIMNILRFHKEGQAKPFWNGVLNPYGPFLTLKEITKNKNNAGFALCSFAKQGNDDVWNEGQRQGYLWMCEHYKLLYQSTVRNNANTGNQFFFCVFDLRSKV